MKYQYTENGNRIKKKEDAARFDIPPSIHIHRSQDTNKNYLFPLSLYLIVGIFRRMNVTEEKLFHQLSALCLSITNGDYSQVKSLEELTIEGRYPKEITDLAESFSVMLLKLEARELKLEEIIEELKKAKAQIQKHNETLIKKVTTLVIDIDSIKKTQEVYKITETPFFKEIKQK